MKIPPNTTVSIRPMNETALFARVRNPMDGTVRCFVSQSLDGLPIYQCDEDEVGNIHATCPRWAEVDLQELEKLV